MYGGYLLIEYRNDMQEINFRKTIEHSGNRILQSLAFRTVSLEISRRGRVAEWSNALACGFRSGGRRFKSQPRLRS